MQRSLQQTLACGARQLPAACPNPRQRIRPFSVPPPLWWHRRGCPRSWQPAHIWGAERRLSGGESAWTKDRSWPVPAVYSCVIRPAAGWQLLLTSSRARPVLPCISPRTKILQARAAQRTPYRQRLGAHLYALSNPCGVRCERSQRIESGLSGLGRVHSDNSASARKMKWLVAKHFAHGLDRVIDWKTRALSLCVDCRRQLARAPLEASIACTGRRSAITCTPFPSRPSRVLS